MGRKGKEGVHREGGKREGVKKRGGSVRKPR